MSAVNCEGEEDTTTREPSQINSLSIPAYSQEQDILMKTAQFAPIVITKPTKPEDDRRADAFESKPKHMAAVSREFSPRLERREQQVTFMMEQILSKVRQLPSEALKKTWKSQNKQSVARIGIDSAALNTASNHSNGSQAQQIMPGSLNSSSDRHVYPRSKDVEGLQHRISDSLTHQIGPSEKFRIRGSSSNRKPGADTLAHKFDMATERLNTDPCGPTLRLFDHNNAFVSQSSKYIKKVNAPNFNRSEREEDRFWISNSYMKSWNTSDSNLQVPLGLDASKRGSALSSSNLSTAEHRIIKYRDDSSRSGAISQKSTQNLPHMHRIQENMGFFESRPTGTMGPPAYDRGTNHRQNSYRKPEEKSADSFGHCGVMEHKPTPELRLKGLEAIGTNPDVTRVKPKVSFDKLLLGRQRTGNSPPSSAQTQDYHRGIKMSILINRPKMHSQGITQRDEDALQSIPLGMARRMDRKLIGSEIIPNLPIKAFHPHSSRQGSGPLLNPFLQKDLSAHLKKNSLDGKAAIKTAAFPSSGSSEAQKTNKNKELFIVDSGTRLAKQQNRVMSMLFGQQAS